MADEPYQVQQIETPTWVEFRRVMGVLLSLGFVYGLDERSRNVLEANRLQRIRRTTEEGSELPYPYLLVGYYPRCRAAITPASYKVCPHGSITTEKLTEMLPALKEVWRNKRKERYLRGEG